MGKQNRLPFNKKKDKVVNGPLQEIHPDVCGPFSLSLKSYRFFVVFIDKYSHYCVTHVLQHKSEVIIKFREFVEKSEAHFNLRVANL